MGCWMITEPEARCVVARPWRGLVASCLLSWGLMPVRAADCTMKKLDGWFRQLCGGGDDSFLTVFFCYRPLFAFVCGSAGVLIGVCIKARSSHRRG